MAIVTVTEKQLIVKVSTETAAKLTQLAKTEKIKMDSCITKILEAAVKDIVLEPVVKKARAKKVAAPEVG